ncbi:GDSL-type esterase/lipase family protein [Actinoplanes sp. NPDC051494]|uniref:GDSL-type esterase/lipase family protein n=1 Tax=Actinoplanes sp. NPDC051494 TaxID=3363907 RepID=UPI0037B2117F
MESLRYRLLALAAATSIAVVVAPVPAHARAATLPALRVLPLGDSITYGSGSTPTGSGYRPGLLQKLTAQSASTVDFVGSQRDGTGPDPAHEGRPGWTIEQLAGIAGVAAQRYRPNLVTLHIGTNDMDRDIDVATAGERLRALVTTVLAAAPETTVLVAGLVPAKVATVNTRVGAYNLRQAAVVDDFRSQGRHVHYVDMGAVDTATDLSDNLHPNNLGYAKMADAFLAATQQVDDLGWLAAPATPAAPVPAPVGAAPAAGTWADAGVIASGTNPPAGAQIQFADVDRDGRKDYLEVRPGGETRAWHNPGSLHNGSLWQSLGRIASGTGAEPADIRWSDVNGDGRSDYVVVDPASGMIKAWLCPGVFKGDAGGWWAVRGKVASGTGAVTAANRLLLADLNADGFDDYLRVNAAGAVTAWLHPGLLVEDGSGWQALGQIATGTGAPAGSEIQFGDINNDGYDDYLVIDGTNGSVRAWLNRGGTAGNWTWVGQGQIAPGDGVSTATHRVVETDIDGDGRSDHLTVGTNGAVHAWLNRGRDTTAP